MSLQEEQARFMQACDKPTRMYPITENTMGTLTDEIDLWRTLIREEHQELSVAINNLEFSDEQNYWDNLAEVGAEAVDVIYTICGLANTLGIPLEAMFYEIHNANMRKVVDGKVIRREDGKILKPEGWEPANKLRVILEARDYKV